LRLVQLGAVRQVVELCQDVILFDFRAVINGLPRPAGIGSKAFDDAHDLGTDVDDLERFDRPGGTNGD